MEDNKTIHYPSVLREKGEVEFEGVTLRYLGEWDALEPGDTYIAQRNTVKLLTVREVKETAGDQNQWAGWVVPQEIAYCFDLGECVKVEVEL